MNETQLKNMLTQADQAFRTECGADSTTLAQTARHRVAIRKRRRAEWLTGGTLILLLAVCLLGYTQFKQYQAKKQIALQIQIKKELDDLKAETDYTLALIKSINQRTQQRKQLAALRQRLASITAQTDNTQTEDEKLASALYQKAETLSTRANSCNAVKTLYQQIIQTFPNSSYTNPAREKLAQLDCLNGIHL